MKKNPKELLKNGKGGKIKKKYKNQLMSIYYQ